MTNSYVESYPGYGCGGGEGKGGGRVAFKRQTNKKERY